MSVEIPTSEARPGRPPPPVRRPPTWALVGVGTIVGVALWAILAGDDTPPGPSETEEILTVDDPTAPLEQWELVTFPGAGTFVDVATGEGAAVAVARIGRSFDADAVGSAVWIRDGSTWRMAELEDADRAAVSSAAVTGSEVLLGGSVDETPVPALWVGPAAGPFRSVDPPFEGPGHIDAVRDLDGVVVLIGRRTETRSGPPRGTPVVLVGEGGRWRDATPDDAEFVTEIVTLDGRWTAVGGRDGQAMIWESASRGTVWEDRPPVLESAAVLVDAALTGSETYALAVLTDEGGLPVQLLSSVTSWRPVGEPRPHTISWIAEIDGGIVGGHRFGQADVGHPYLWRHESGGRWSIVPMADSERETTPTVFSAADGDTVVGGVAGQPAMWRAEAGDTVQVPVPAEADHLWERVATLPSGPFVSFLGETMAVIDPTIASPSPTGRRLLLSDDGFDWQERPLPDGFGIVGVHQVAGHPIAFGIQASKVTVGRLDGEGFEVLAALEGAPVGFGVTDDAIVIYLHGSDATTRHEIPAAGGPGTEIRLPFVAVAVRSIGAGVELAGVSGNRDGRATESHISLDGGRTWTPLEVLAWDMHRVDSEIIVSEAEPPHRTFRLTLDPLGLEPIELPEAFRSAPLDGLSVSEWADGLVARDDDAFVYLWSIDAEPVRLEFGVETGFFGVHPIPAADGHVVTQEGDVWVLYRWTGRMP